MISSNKISHCLHVMHLSHKGIKMVSIPLRFFQNGLHPMKWIYELSSRHIHTALKLCKSPSTDLSPKKNEDSTKCLESNVTQVDISKRVFQKQESSLPTHDISRITPEHRKFELKADDIFDELSISRGANKETFLSAVNTYIKKETLYRRGAVEFIYSGLQRMKFFGVEKDLMAYKALIQAFPEGKMIPRNVWQVEFMHYPRQQHCGIELLEQMEHNGVIPDDEFGKLLFNRFGIAAHVSRKYRRMMYWLPKFKNMNPYPIPVTLPTDPIELALVALRRMCVDLSTKYDVYKTSALDIATQEDTFIVSAQSPVQQHLVTKHNSDQPLFVEGPYPVYLRATRQHYFLLRAEPDIKGFMKEKQRHLDEEDDNKLFEWTSYFDEENCQDIQPILTVHEQEDSTVLALCITGTCTKSSVVSWIRCLERCNPNLVKTPVLFKLMTPGSEIEAVGDNRPVTELLK